MFGAMMQLLLQPHSLSDSPNANEAGRWSDLVVKCMIKITKSLPTTIDVSQSHVNQAHCRYPLHCHQEGGLRWRGLLEDPQWSGYHLQYSKKSACGAVWIVAHGQQTLPHVPRPIHVLHAVKLV